MTPKKRIKLPVQTNTLVEQNQATQNSVATEELPGQTTLLQPKAPQTEYKILSIDLIDDPERPMRTDMTPQSVEDLVMSIKQVGLIEPLILKEKNGRYEVIAGHRRKYACELAKIVLVPCFVRIANNEQTEMIKIHENLFRQEVKPTDEALHFKYLIDKLKLSPTKIAQLISKSESYVSDRMAIFSYPTRLKEVLDNGQLSFSVCREFARLDDEAKVIEYVHYAVRNGITMEGARKWVQDYKRSKEQPQVQQNQYYNPDTQQQVVESISDCFYCLKAVKLLEASVVYAHSDCVNERMKNKEQEQNHQQQQLS